jgi:hypothetical protein
MCEPAFGLAFGNKHTGENLFCYFGDYELSKHGNLTSLGGFSTAFQPLHVTFIV